MTIVRDRFIVGTPDECRAEIRRYHDLLGVNYFLLARSGGRAAESRP
jgi:alkanesulfonate monooxygenase SsuD/methylene tetrahydromethanopterin reductase-like flavin-dependent oxidoreductase (luciferase family)